jgi:hypothetical protein
METEEFKTLAADMKAEQDAFSNKCKEKILAVQTLVFKGAHQDLCKHFYKGLKRIAIMLMSEHEQYTDEKPCPYAKFIYWMTIADDRISQAVYHANATTQALCSVEFKNGIEGYTEGTAIGLSQPENELYLKIRDDAVKIVKAVFLTAWNTVQGIQTESATTLRLKKTAIEMIEREKTIAAAMEIEAEPSTNPKMIRDLITEGIKKATADLQKEVNKLQQTVRRSNMPKNSNRGASSSHKSAPSTNKKERGTGKGEKNESNKKLPNGKNKGQQNKNKNRATSPSPQKKRGRSPERKDPASPSANKSKKDKPTGGSKQQQKKGKKNPNKKTSS